MSQPAPTPSAAVAQPTKPKTQKLNPLQQGFLRQAALASTRPPPNKTDPKAVKKASAGTSKAKKELAVLEVMVAASEGSGERPSSSKRASPFTPTDRPDLTPLHRAVSPCANLERPLLRSPSRSRAPSSLDPSSSSPSTAQASTLSKASAHCPLRSYLQDPSSSSGSSSVLSPLPTFLRLTRAVQSRNLSARSLPRKSTSLHLFQLPYHVHSPASLSVLCADESRTVPRPLVKKPPPLVPRITKQGLSSEFRTEMEMSASPSASAGPRTSSPLSSEQNLPCRRFLSSCSLSLSFPARQVSAQFLSAPSSSKAPSRIVSSGLAYPCAPTLVDLGLELSRLLPPPPYVLPPPPFSPTYISPQIPALRAPRPPPHPPRRTHARSPPTALSCSTPTPVRPPLPDT